MDERVETRPIAWQPLTPRGVAAFARATGGRLLLVQFFFALLAAATVVWFLRECWFPTIHEAISQLPAHGEIRGGALDWQGDSPLILAEGRFLALAVDLDHDGLAPSPAHARVEVEPTDLPGFRLLGLAKRAYRSEEHTAELHS